MGKRAGQIMLEMAKAHTQMVRNVWTVILLEPRVK
jgi:hypothetical protein